jgi:histidinol-phosphatase
MSFSLEDDLERALVAARRAGEAATKASRRHFRTGVAVEKKPDRSPVTAADRESEAAILGELLSAFPDASVLAEESGARPGDPELRWIVDPLDGTRGFTRGGTFWGPLVALEHRGEIVVGATALPALGETYWAARGLGCFGNEGAAVRVSRVDDWSEATLSLGELRGLLSPPFGDSVSTLLRSAASVRCYGDVASAVMVLTGRAEAWLEAGVQVWDIAPMAVLFEEAGGRFTDLRGAPSLRGGTALATNGLLHPHVLAELGVAPKA